MSGEPGSRAGAPRRLAQRALIAASLVLGWLGLHAYLRAHLGPVPLSDRVRGALLVVVAALPLLAAAAWAGSHRRSLVATSHVGLRRLLSRGLARIWPAAVPLALLPAAPGGTAIVLAFAAFALLAARVGTLAATPSTTGERARVGPFAPALLGFVLAVTILYLGVGASAHGSFQNDSAYYYGVARHMAETRRFEEPIVWHFVRPPRSLLHPPFDYWGGATSLLLAPVLALFGAKHETALLAMAAISAASVLAFWYLVSVAHPLRTGVAQAIAVIAFALSPALAIYRFDTESLPLFHLLLIASLIAFARRRFVISTALAFGLMLTRGDGTILFALLVLGALASAGGSPRAPRRAPILLTAGLLLGAYVAYQWVSHRSLTPPGAAAAPFLAREVDLYSFGRPDLHRPRWDFLTLAYVKERSLLAFTSLREIRFGARRQEIWLAGAAIVALAWLRRRASFAGLVALLLLAGPIAVTCGSHAVFAPWRTLYTFVPLVVLGGAMGLDALLVGAEKASRPLRSTPIHGLILGACALAACHFTLEGSSAYGPRHPGVGGTHDIELELRALDAMLGGEPVASDRPWYIIANTHSPSLMLPENGEAAIAAALRRYGVRWVVLCSRPSGMRGAQRVFGALERTGHLELQDVRIERATQGRKLWVYRVTETGGGAERR